MHRKFISVITATVLLSDTLFAATASNDFFDSVTTGSAASTWTTKSGGQYMYGGQYTFKFVRQATPKPALDFETPKIKAGCNGISIQGGFIAFLGLDDIKDQLSSSAQQAVLGVVMGLVYSLPGIADAFEKVHTWVRWLQQLLKNSCQTFSVLTQNYLKDKNTAGGQVMTQINNGTTNFNQLMKDGETKLEKAVTDLFAESNKTSSQVKPEKAFRATVKNPTSTNFTKANENQISALQENTIVDKTLSDMDGFITNQEYKRNFMFKMVFLGYYGYSPNDMASYRSDLSKEDLAREVTEDFIMPTGSGTTPVWQRGLAFENPANSDRIVNLILYGANNDTIQVPNIKIKLAYLKKETSSGTASSEGTKYISMFGLPNLSDNSSYAYQWRGIYTESYNYIKAVVNSDGTATTNVPFVFPNGNKYVTLLKVLKRSGVGDALIDSLASILAKKNALMLLEAILTEVETQSREYASGGFDDSQQKQTINKMYEELKNINLSDSSLNDTVALFERYEKEHASDIANGAKQTIKQRQ
ncbi:MAG: conjugal transfer protein TraH [Campylobacterales bacterium]|nr:conjugal transfer protein TraH [Campylobacterales bacterium]